MLNEEHLTDEAGEAYRSGLTPPAAVWRVLRAHGMADSPGAKVVAKRMLSRLQGRAVARRLKQKKCGEISLKEVSQDRYLDALATIAERNGDPED